jgi:cytochrome c-type biogenesis protein CcmE
VPRRRSPARLIVALSVAAVLAVFLLYTSIAGGGTPSVSPSELAGRSEKVSLSGQVVGPISGDPRGAGLRFRVKDIRSDAATTVAVLYRGSVPDQFKVGRELVVDGRLRDGTFVAEPGSMVTKCPSKYTAKTQE